MGYINDYAYYANSGNAPADENWGKVKISPELAYLHKNMGNVKTDYRSPEAVTVKMSTDFYNKLGEHLQVYPMKDFSDIEDKTINKTNNIAITLVVASSVK